MEGEKEEEEATTQDEEEVSILLIPLPPLSFLGSLVLAVFRVVVVVVGETRGFSRHYLVVK